jgi:hypothetical protein
MGQTVLRPEEARGSGEGEAIISAIVPSTL